MHSYVNIDIFYSTSLSILLYLLINLFVDMQL